MNNDKQQLVESLDHHIKSLQKQILDITELVVPAQNWKAIRSKILGITNDVRRDMAIEIESNYGVKAINEDIIRVITPKPQPLNPKTSVTISYCNRDKNKGED